MAVSSATGDDQLTIRSQADRNAGWWAGARRGLLLCVVCAVVVLAAAYDIETATHSHHRSAPRPGSAPTAQTADISVHALSQAQQPPALNLQPKRHVARARAPAAAAPVLRPTTTILTATTATTPTTASTASTFSPGSVTPVPAPPPPAPVSQRSSGGSGQPGIGHTGSGTSSVSGTTTTTTPSHSSAPGGTGVVNGGG